MGKAGTETDKLKNHMIFYHRVGTTQEEDVMVFKDDENPYMMHYATVSNDGQYVLIDSAKDSAHKDLLKYADIS